jgi:hypothetical protein
MRSGSSGESVPRFYPTDSSRVKSDRLLERKIEKLDYKIEITARDLVIKGASGLVILASLLIGLKLFG